MSFGFDPQKSARNNDKHGIDFDQAQTLWLKRVAERPAAITEGEMRYENIGKIGDTHWTAIVTYRGRIRRFIPVYRSSPPQIEFYERTQRSKN